MFAEVPLRPIYELFPMFSLWFWGTVVALVVLEALLCWHRHVWKAVSAAVLWVAVLLAFTDLPIRLEGGPTLVNIFVLWSLPFWGLLLVEAVFLFWCVAWKRGFSALTSLLGLAVALHFFGNVPVFSWVFEHPFVMLGLAFAYVASSIPWGFQKWKFHVKDNRKSYNHILEGYLEHNADLRPAFESNTLTAAQKVEWKRYFDRNRFEDEYGDPVEFEPNYRQHKSDIMTWMVLWPLDMTWTFCHDRLIRLWDDIYHRMGKQLEAITKAAWAGTEGHMPTKAEEEEVERQRYAVRQ